MVIESDVVEATWEDFAELGADEARAQAGRARKAQPELMSFALAFTGQLSPAAQEFAVYVYHVIWEAFRRATPRQIPRIQRQAIEARWAEAASSADQLEGVDASRLDRVAAVWPTSQPFVFRYMVEAIKETGDDADDGIDLTAAETGTIFLVLDTVIELLHAQREAALGGEA
jgi:hypothetical protein